MNDSTLFYEASGGKNRQGRAFGFGSTVKLYEERSTSSNRTRARQSTTTQFETLNDRMDQLEQVNARLVDVNARLVDDVAEMRTLFQNLRGNQRGTPSPSGVPPTTNDDVGENMGGDASCGIDDDVCDDANGYGFS